MKKLFSVMLLTLAFGLGVTLVSCGDDMDDPDPSPMIIRRIKPTQ